MVLKCGCSAHDYNRGPSRGRSPICPAGTGTLPRPRPRFQVVRNRGRSTVPAPADLSGTRGPGDAPPRVRALDSELSAHVCVPVSESCKAARRAGGARASIMRPRKFIFLPRGDFRAAISRAVFARRPLRRRVCPRLLQVDGENVPLKGSPKLAFCWSAQASARSGQVRFITRPKSRTMRATRQLMLPPSTVS